MPNANGGDTEVPSRLVITVAFVAVLLFIAAEPLVVPWASRGMQIFQAVLMVLIWLLFMFGTPRRS